MSFVGHEYGLEKKSSEELEKIDDDENENENENESSE